MKHRNVEAEVVAVLKQIESDYKDSIKRCLEVFKAPRGSIIDEQIKVWEKRLSKVQKTLTALGITVSETTATKGE